MTLDKLLAGLEDRSLRLHNLFQRENGEWQANVRREAPGETTFYGYGVGPTALAALEAALDTKPVEHRKTLAGMKTTPVSQGQPAKKVTAKVYQNEDLL